MPPRAGSTIWVSRGESLGAAAETRGTRPRVTRWEASWFKQPGKRHGKRAAFKACVKDSAASRVALPGAGLLLVVKGDALSGREAHSEGVNLVVAEEGGSAAART
jgi:hypothetical protein